MRSWAVFSAILAGLLSGCDSASPPATLDPGTEVRGTEFLAPTAATPTPNATGDAPTGPAVSAEAPAADSTPSIDAAAPAGATPTAAAPIVGPMPEAKPAARPAGGFGMGAVWGSPPPAPERDGFRSINFDELASYEYDPIAAGVPLLGSTPNPQQTTERVDQIPAAIRKLNGTRAGVAGFMMPIEMEKDRVKSFLLMRNQLACCFGMMVGFNEWIFVELPDGRPTKFVPDVPIVAYGTLEVGEEIEDGIVMSIYRMAADDVVPRGGF